MHGNAWEWVQDCWQKNYKNYPSNNNANIHGDLSRRVIRGGSWLSNSIDIRSSTRTGQAVASRSNQIGFRLAQD